MFYTKSKEIRLGLCLFVLSTLLTPALAQTNQTAIVLAEAETGSMAARQAAEQKAALAKKAAEREAKKAAEAQKPAEVTAPNEANEAADEQKGK